MTMTRELALELCERLGISDEEAGEPQWQAYLNAGQIVSACKRLRGEDAVRDALAAACQTD